MSFIYIHVHVILCIQTPLYIYINMQVYKYTYICRLNRSHFKKHKICQGHPTHRWQRRDVNPGLPGCKGPKLTSAGSQVMTCVPTGGTPSHLDEAEGPVRSPRSGLSTRPRPREGDYRTSFTPTHASHEIIKVFTEKETPPLIRTH